MVQTLPSYLYLSPLEFCIHYAKLLLDMLGLDILSPIHVYRGDSRLHPMHGRFPSYLYFLIPCRPCGTFFSFLMFEWFGTRLSEWRMTFRLICTSVLARGVTGIFIGWDDRKDPNNNNNMDWRFNVTLYFDPFSPWLSCSTMAIPISTMWASPTLSTSSFLTGIFRYIVLTSFRLWIVDSVCSSFYFTLSRVKISGNHPYWHGACGQFIWSIKNSVP